MAYYISTEDITTNMYSSKINTLQNQWSSEKTNNSFSSNCTAIASTTVNKPGGYRVLFSPGTSGTTEIPVPCFSRTHSVSNSGRTVTLLFEDTTAKDIRISYFRVTTKSGNYWTRTSKPGGEVILGPNGEIITGGSSSYTYTNHNISPTTVTTEKTNEIVESSYTSSSLTITCMPHSVTGNTATRVIDTGTKISTPYSGYTDTETYSDLVGNNVLITVNYSTDTTNCAYIWEHFKANQTTPQATPDITL